MSKWVLQDGTHFFKQMTGIGPMSTSDIFEAQEFDTKEDAQMSPAMRFALMSYVPVQVSETRVTTATSSSSKPRKTTK